MTQQSATREIAEATAEYPLLKTNKEFRELTLAIIESAAANGEVVPLKSAAQKVMSLIGKEEKGLRAARTGVEGVKPVPNNQPDNEEERVIQGILNAGASNSGLGGL